MHILLDLLVDVFVVTVAHLILHVVDLIHRLVAVILMMTQMALAYLVLHLVLAASRAAAAAREQLLLACGRVEALAHGVLLLLERIVVRRPVVVLQLEVRSRVDQQLHAVEPTKVRCRDQSRRVVRLARVEVGLGFEQQADDRGVPGLGRHGGVARFFAAWLTSARTSSSFFAHGKLPFRAAGNEAGAAVGCSWRGP